MTGGQLSRAELLALPPATDLPTLGRALGVSEPTVREMHRRGELEGLGIRVLRLGRQWRVVTSTLLDVLGIGWAEGGSGPAPPDAGPVPDMDSASRQTAGASSCPQ